MNSGLVISYVDCNLVNIGQNETNIKHVILRRQSPFKYTVNKKKNSQLTTLQSLIRAFVKLKYVYCDANKIYPKNTIF